MLKTFRKNTNVKEENNFKELSILMKKAVGYNTISEFANKCGIPNSARTIADIIHGRISMFPEIGFLKRIALGSDFRVSIDELKLACGYNLDEDILDLRKVHARRGWICYCDLGKVLDSEMGGVRPALIISNDVGNSHASIIGIIPISSRISKNRQCTHVRIGIKDGLTRESEILVEQMRTVSKRRLMLDGYDFIQPICECSDEVLRQVEIAIMKSTGIAHIKINESVIDRVLNKLNNPFNPLENNYHVNHNYNTTQQSVYV